MTIGTMITAKTKLFSNSNMIAPGEKWKRLFYRPAKKTHPPFVPFARAAAIGENSLF
jgi:hypothetical protein